MQFEDATSAYCPKGNPLISVCYKSCTSALEILISNNRIIGFEIIDFIKGMTNGGNESIKQDHVLVQGGHALEVRDMLL